MAKKSINKPTDGSNFAFDTKKSWLASAMCIKDSHLGECLLSTNVREDRRLNFILLRLERENKENLRMQRIQKWNFIRRSYLLRHQPVQVTNGNKLFTIEISNSNERYSKQRIRLPRIQTTLSASSLLYQSNSGSFFTRHGVESCHKQLNEIKTK